MAKSQEIKLALSSNVGRNRKNSQELLVNLMAIIHDGTPKNQVTLQSTAGHKELYDLTGERLLGIHTVKEIVYVVTNKHFYSFDREGLVDLGEVYFDDDVISVSIEDNGFDIVFVGGDGYYYNIESAELNSYNTVEGYFTSDTVAFIDGYFIFNRRGTMQFFISGLYSTELDPLDFASKEANPDDLMGVIVSNRSLWLVGRRSTETWTNIGARDFPFIRVSGAVQEVGTSNPLTIAKVWGSIFFLGSDGAVYKSNGYQLSRISTESIEYYLRKQSIEQADAFTYSEEGHGFYCLTINNIYTFVYDMKSGLWHNRSSARDSRWAIKRMVQYSITNQNIGIDFESGKIYQVDLDIPTEDGKAITRQAFSVPLHNGISYASMASLELDIEIGDLADPREEGKMKMQFSDDGGNNWSNVKEAFISPTGDYSKRVYFRRLGRFKERTIKLIYQEPTELKILGAFARITNVER